MGECASLCQGLGEGVTCTNESIATINNHLNNNRFTMQRVKCTKGRHTNKIHASNLRILQASTYIATLLGYTLLMIDKLNAALGVTAQFYLLFFYFTGKLDSCILG